jgi:hypothetical protein
MHIRHAKADKIPVTLTLPRGATGVRMRLFIAHVLLMHSSVLRPPIEDDGGLSSVCIVDNLLAR